MSKNEGKYIIHATIRIDGTVQRKDVVGAIFGQTEGLLGEDLQLEICKEMAELVMSMFRSTKERAV